MAQSNQHDSKQSFGNRPRGSTAQGQRTHVISPTAVTDAGFQALLDYNDASSLNATLWSPTSEDLARFAEEFPVTTSETASVSPRVSWQDAIESLRSEIKSQHEEFTSLSRFVPQSMISGVSTDLFRDLHKAVADLRHLKDMMSKVLGIADDLWMWSSALNPVVSMLVERMGDTGGNPVEDHNIESWLDLAE